MFNAEVLLEGILCVAHRLRFSLSRSFVCLKFERILRTKQRGGDWETHHIHTFHVYVQYIYATHTQKTTPCLAASRFLILAPCLLAYSSRSASISYSGRRAQGFPVACSLFVRRRWIFDLIYYSGHHDPRVAKLFLFYFIIYSKYRIILFL